MKDRVLNCIAVSLGSIFIIIVGATPVAALQVQEKKGRFEQLAVEDPAAAVGVLATPVATLESTAAARAGWDQFKIAHGQNWQVYLDRRSGAPLLVEGPGIPWSVTQPGSVDGLEASVREFMTKQKALLLADDSELVLNRDGSGELIDSVWQLSFDHVVRGIPVVGERYLFTIGHGRLITFGSPRWTRIDASAIPELTADEAQQVVALYMQLGSANNADFFEKPRLEFLPLHTGERSQGGAYAGPIGAGYTAALVWRVAVRVDGDLGTWVAQVDAQTGVIRTFRDENQYARVKGGVYPTSNDQIAPDGVEQPNYPMPFANIIGTPNQITTTMGLFNCTPAGASMSTTLNGQYIRISDGCGLIGVAVTCDNDLDLKSGPGTDCAVPSGTSAGDTHSARSSFYHLNRIAEHARAWLPGNAWIQSKVSANVNINDTCNAFWDGAGLNFFKSGGPCNNTGEIAGVFLHEWGHGLDQNDGGGFDNPSEAYADVTSVLATHVSCMGRGFHPATQCGGYGNTCLSCTGIRDLDWDKRIDHLPSTPAGFVTMHCPSGGGPCGREVHCEGYVGAETIWDLATRDLPASGFDLPTAWQLTDKLWYKSRLGSGGNAYTCSLPTSDGCAATSWFTKFRAIDDDDGNLANGTPHAAAIFAAFNRHAIACGTAASQSNQNSSACPTIGAPVLSSSIANQVANLSWTPVANATSYRILRNEYGCAAGSTIVATVTTTSFQDTGLANGFTEYYTIQAAGGTNNACDGVLSNCQAATPQPFPGAVKLNAASYLCTGQIGVTVVDANIGAGTTTANLVSATEPAGETVTLTQISPGSDTYTGTLNLTAAAPAPNGVLSVTSGDTITATYIDASDGGGGLNIPRQTTATADCVNPLISKVQATNITGTAAKITWTTNEPANSVVHYGTTPPPAGTATVATAVLPHVVDVNGLTECTPYVYSVDSTDVVGNLTTDNAGGSFYAFSTGKSTPTSYVSTDGPVPIPDNDQFGATSTIVVSDVRTVQDINVIINVAHTFDGDLTFTLLLPNGNTILLANPHGGSSNNYTNTVLDDEAAIPITPPAPFTGTFRPDSPLFVADGINSAGAWGFKAVDRSGGDSGSILNWTLQLTYANPACGSHASLRSQARVSDTCLSGGPGNGNGSWDAGEHVKVKVTLANDGTNPLTGVSATLTSSTPGVVIEDGSATFPDIPADATADSIAPHFAVGLPESLACGGNVAFNLSVATAQGGWSGSFTQFVGAATNGTGRVLDERFDSGIPATWTVLDGGGGGGAASKWTTNNPGVRSIAAPMLVPVATIDSDAAGAGATQDESLLTPVLDLSTATTATLQFDQFFRWFAGGTSENADVDVRSSATGGAWVTVLHQAGAGTANPDHRTVDISAQAAGAADAQVRFHYWNGSNEEYWQIDNVTIDTSAPGSCAMSVCGPPGARAVADGIFGTPMRGDKANPTATTINLTWDATSCVSADYHLLYGNLGSVASATVLGAACDLGTSGSAAWTGVPAGNLWFVVVGDDNAATESSWGTDGVGGQRGGVTASGQCGTSVRDNSGVCP